MWIMLLQKLPVNPSPPRMSIHWSTPWPMDGPAIPTRAELREAIVLATRRKHSDLSADDEARFQIRRAQIDAHQVVRRTEWYGKEPDDGARRIHYQGESIRVWPHEFSEPSRENLMMFLVGAPDVPPSHVLVPGSVADDTVIDHNQAVAMGIDVTTPDAEIPAIGWYRLRPEYAVIFNTDGEDAE